MATQWKTMSSFAFTLPNRTGELARLTEKLGKAKINLLGLWGYAEGEESPRLSCVPADAKAFRDFARSQQLRLEEGRAFYLVAEDQPAALLDSLEKIAKAGINVDAIEAVAAGGKFGCFLWPSDADFDKVKKVLSAA